MKSVEVVIPTHNRREPLQRCLAALSDQSFDDFSVALVDDASDEPVASWLEAARYPFPIRQMRVESNAGPAHARNLAARSSASEYIAFIDDDVVADPHWLRNHWDAFHRAGPQAVVIGPLLAPPDWRPTPWNRWEAETIAVEYRRMLAAEYAPTWRQFFTGNAFLARDAFLAAGGFNEDFKRAEDIEFAYRLARGGATFIFEPNAIGLHYAERSLASWRRMAAQYAAFDAAIDRMYPELQWTKFLQRERRRRHWLTRTASRTAASTRLQAPAATFAILLARCAHRSRQHRISSNLLSLAFQLDYDCSSRQQALGQRFNAASTARA